MKRFESFLFKGFSQQNDLINQRRINLIRIFVFANVHEMTDKMHWILVSLDIFRNGMIQFCVDKNRFFVFGQLVSSYKAKDYGKYCSCHSTS